jgi:ribosome maturation factor RimP
VTLEDCANVSRDASQVLDVEELIPDHRYHLEVSSPGLDRPLKKPADYLRFSGERVDLTLKLAFKGRKHFQGVLEPFGESWQLVFNADGVDQALGFAFDEVREARLVPVVDFKGRRFAAPAQEPTEQVESAATETDGDRKR